MRLLPGWQFSLESRHVVLKSCCLNGQTSTGANGRPFLVGASAPLCLGRRASEPASSTAHSLDRLTVFVTCDYTH